MLDVYYLNIAVLLIPFLESLRQYVERLAKSSSAIGPPCASSSRQTSLIASWW